MSDIFVSYAREDEARIRPLVAAFEAEGWSVFWDRRIPAGSTWRSHIGAALQQAHCVVVAWSAHSVESQWVLEEADEGKARQVLVPVMLDAVTPPRGFREIQVADLSGWVPGQASEHLAHLLGDMRRLLGRAPAAPAPAPAAAPVQAAAPASAAPAAGQGWRNGIVAIAALALVAIAGYVAFGPHTPPAGKTRPPDEPAVRRPPPAAQSPAGDWLVVAGSFTRAEKVRAERQLMAVMEAGFDARLVDSSAYPLLAPDLWVVAIGPFDNRAAANAALERLQPRVSDAYVKKAR